MKIKMPLVCSAEGSPAEAVDSRLSHGKQNLINHSPELHHMLPVTFSVRSSTRSQRTLEGSTGVTVLTGHRLEAPILKYFALSEEGWLGL